MAPYVFRIGDEVHVVGTKCPGGIDGWPMTGLDGVVTGFVQHPVWGKLVQVQFEDGKTFFYVPDDIVIEIVGENRRKYL